MINRITPSTLRLRSSVVNSSVGEGCRNPKSSSSMAKTIQPGYMNIAIIQKMKIPMR